MDRHLIDDRSEILVGRGRPHPLLPPSDRRSAVALLVQPGAAHLAPEIASEVDSGLERPVETIELADGEAAKTPGEVERIYAELARIGLGRDDTVATLGGGAATDAGGFVAATWMRGVEAVHLPTTLLGAVDASIGGKTAMNVAGKNLVGVFWHPSRVVVDLDVLDSLPLPLKREGAAEVIKAGLIAEPGVVDAYRRSGLAVALDDVVPTAIGVKCRIVGEDFTEHGVRAVLNLGHTVGHAIEYASTVSHGEAVSIGLVAEAHIAARVLGFDELEPVVEALTAAELPVAAPSLDRTEVMELMRRDKKRDRAGLRMALLHRIGGPEVVHVTDDDVRAGLSAVGI